MNFLDELDAEEMAEGHEDHADGHQTGIDRDTVNRDGKVLVYCTDCPWEAWARP